MITIHNVCLSYGERHVLCHITQHIGPHDFIVLTGPNGGGKTTLLRLLAGLLPPTCGRIDRRKGTVTGYLPQYRHVDRRFPSTVADMVLTGMECRKRPWQRFSAAHRAQAAEALQLFGLTELAGRPISDLSGGQWQRTLLARAFAPDPDILLLDEPETHLDEEWCARLYAALTARSPRTATVMVSHHDDPCADIPLRRFWHVENGTLLNEELGMRNQFNKE